MFMIDEILKKAENNQKLTDEEFLELLNISNDEDLNKLFDTAAKIRVKSNLGVNTVDLQKRLLLKDIIMHFINQMKKFYALLNPSKKQTYLV